ncbi:Alpha-tubulin suppressor and related RCC1 domain- containing protein-like protein [Haliangium ochraceum DSM 14365]|uniref:Alpha-tubulin suppressor and related RCC1 domain-containing protein-like protein n=2 Tax=Haliangium ochraceum TaxID=80816 RepID=D0LHE7_HALO1|nr:Alpha-tubulin suppressor and related RCC1 domain- containing protein-like protein [Haliangium ochraceum DSM 14365]
MNEQQRQQRYTTMHSPITARPRAGACERLRRGGLRRGRLRRGRLRHGIAFASLLVLALCALGCDAEGDHSSESVTLQVRFHGDEVAEQSLRGLHALLAPIERSDVSEILVDVRYASNGQPFVLNFALTREGSTNAWQGTLPFLPRDEELRFFAKAYDSADILLFTGETLATLTIVNQSVVIPLAPLQDEETFDLPRLVRIVYPSEVIAGQEVQIIFTIEGNAGETLDYTIAGDDGSAPFTPFSGSVTLASSVADFIALYTAPEVDEVSDFHHQMVLSSVDALSSVAVATDFTTRVIPRDQGIPGVTGTRPSVRFNPVVLRMVANGSAIPGEVELFADVSDDTDEAELVYQWGFEANDGTPAASFADAGANNPGRLQSYTGAHQGTITLAVTDEAGGTTTLYYEMLPAQFTHIVDHDAANGLRRIVAGSAHTCVLTGEGKVRCWGENQYGQLGYGNLQDIGGAATHLPYTAGDVPLPEPARQLVAGYDHTCALLESGLIYCWGKNNFGQLGYNRDDNVGDGEPVTSAGYVTLGGLATKIAAGGNHTCAILEGGFLRCWGENTYGQLGLGHSNPIGDNENVFAAGNVELGDGVVVEDIALGFSHTCALLAGGGMRCWGYNGHGQLGYGHDDNLGDNESLETQGNVAVPGPVRKIVAGGQHTCALLQNNKLRCWGDGGDGRTGYGERNGTNPAYGDDPGELPNGSLDDIDTGADVTDVVAGGAHTCALLSNGALKCWGTGSNGRLGYSDTGNRGTPPALGVDLDGVSAYQIAAGEEHTCALRSNGTARCWGRGLSGRLGSGSEADILSPAAASDIQVFEP